MPNDQNSSHGRRIHYHRGRRGSERRATERRGGPPPAEQAHRDHVDVDQIMRDIRARISTRHGIDFTPQQIQELAARRLEAILEPRHAKPALLEQMRRAAGEPIDVPAPSADAESPFDEASLYESHRGFVRALRKLLNPILKLFFNPAPIAQALTAQTLRNNAAAQRESELYSRQAEWNALHFEIVQRLVTEIARTTLEMQSLVLRVEALDARHDFNERRIRAMDAAPQPSRPPVRQNDAPSPDAAPVSSAGASPPPTAGENGGDGARRRRRRRRGRRSGGASPESAVAPGGAPPGPDPDTDVEGEELEAGDIGDIGPEPDVENTALEPAHHFSLLQPAERYPSAETHPAVSASHDATASQPAPAAPSDNTEPSQAPDPTPSDDTER
jgi:hypothetical protein